MSGRRPWLLRSMVLAVTIVFVALALVVGQGATEPAAALIASRPAPETFVADDFVTVVDEAATEALRDQAEINVSVIREKDLLATSVVLGSITDFFSAVRDAAIPIEPPAPTDPEPTTTSSASSTSSTSSTSTSTTVAGSDEPPDSTTTTSSTSTTTTTTTLPRPLIDDQIIDLGSDFPRVPVETIDVFVQVYNGDFIRIEEELDPVFGAVEEDTVDLANSLLDDGILASEIGALQNDLLTNPRYVFVAGASDEEQLEVQAAVSQLVAVYLLDNLIEDVEATNAARQQARDDVEDVEISYIPGQTIVQIGDILEPYQVDAINLLDLNTPPEGRNALAMAALAGLAVLLGAFFLIRVAPKQWAYPKRFLLFGLILIIAAVTARLPEVLPIDRPDVLYILPAAVFGYFGAILFDPRTAVLLSIELGAFVAIATGDVRITAFAMVAVMTPVPFVSSVSSRRDLRLAVLYSAGAVAVFAAAVAWLFDGSEYALRAAGFGAVGGLGAGIVALGVLPFLENIFNVTTTLTLLDLTDRNHPALRLIEEQAPGTFNHSILVGTLAGKAARAIGADPLLAQAAAYFHDIGKTTNPRYFVENQFGVSNPHDDLPPDESAAILRSHVTEGVRLAKQYKVPTEVLDGIRQHHGTGLMRYFFHRALEADPTIDPLPFRYHGQRPQGKEMAILMLSDSVEGATRALVLHEDPTADGIRKTVENVVGEKVDDHQLDESALTFGELTRVKQALIDALVSYYHPRLSYPGFPGTEATRA
jgi:putative nucleotidyltransferase with HDIG domain